MGPLPSLPGTLVGESLSLSACRAWPVPALVSSTGDPLHRIRTPLDEVPQWIGRRPEAAMQGAC